MFGGSLADPFEAANVSGQLGHGGARTSKMGQNRAAEAISGGEVLSWQPSRPADLMRPFLVLSALAALHGLDPASQVRALLSLLRKRNALEVSSYDNNWLSGCRICSSLILSMSHGHSCAQLRLLFVCMQQHAPALPTLVVLLGRFLSDGATFGILDSLLSKARRAHALGPLHPDGFGKCGDSHRAHAVARAQLTSLLQARLPATTAALVTLGSSGVSSTSSSTSSSVNNHGSGGGEGGSPGGGLSYFAAATVPGLLVPLLPSRAAAMTVVTLFLQDGWRALFLCSIGLCRLLKRRIKAAATAASWLKARRLSAANDDATAAAEWASAKAEDAAAAAGHGDDNDEGGEMGQSGGVEMASAHGGSKQEKAVPPRTASFITRAAAAAATTEAVPMDAQEHRLDSAQAAAVLVTTVLNAFNMKQKQNSRFYGVDVQSK